MNRRFFWLIPEFTKFRTAFETAETVVGANEENEHCLFRKDTGITCFDERKALLLCVATLIKDEKDFYIENREVVCV